jgi:hypothetical protein
MDLSEFQWKKRLLFLFSPSSGSEPFSKLLADVDAQRAEIEDRDLVVIKIVGQGESIIDKEPLDPPSIQYLRKRFGVPISEFSIVLVGKDGSVKLQRKDAVPLSDLFQLIDSMPMRQNEMKRRKSQPS